MHTNRNMDVMRSLRKHSEMPSETDDYTIYNVSRCPASEFKELPEHDFGLIWTRCRLVDKEDFTKGQRWLIKGDVRHVFERWQDKREEWFGIVSSTQPKLNKQMLLFLYEKYKTTQSRT